MSASIKVYSLKRSISWPNNIKLVKIDLVSDHGTASVTIKTKVNKSKRRIENQNG